MKAGILRAPNDLVLGEVADPTPSRGDLIIKVRASTVCGTDIRIFRGRKTTGIIYPAVIGHEFSGEVVETAGSTSFGVGERVCVNPAIPCGHCRACKTGLENVCENLVAIGYELAGSFAEFVRIPSRALEIGNVRRIPGNLSYEEASLAEPLACVINGQNKVSVATGDLVVVLGAGPIGLLHVKLSRFSGARAVLVSEPNAGRREAALAFGADVAINPLEQDLAEIVKAHSNGAGADVVIMAIGVPALANVALHLARPRGRVSLFAGFSAGDMPPVDVNAIHYRELIVTGAFGLSRATFDLALDLLETRRLEVRPFITARYPLARISEALAAAEAGSAVKVAIMDAVPT